MRISLFRRSARYRSVPVPTRRSRGQALVEFALVLVPLMLIFLGILQFGFLYGTQIGLTNAAREAARYAAASQTATSAQATSHGTQVMSQLTTKILPNNVQSFYSANLVTAGAPHTQVCYASYKDPSGNYSVRVTVEVEYRHPMLMPLIGSIIDGLDGTPNDGLRVGSKVEMPVGNQLLQTNPSIDVCTP